MEGYLLNNPSAAGDKLSRCAATAPALWPANVTSVGSPPKALAFLCTQRSSVTWSRRPPLPGIAVVFIDKKPNTFNLKRETVD